ncbi:MAG: PAS domain-containing protein [Desulfobacterales bacterium]|nr:PAS domain-containing protein [Desulfobacterales bacterium]
MPLNKKKKKSTTSNLSELMDSTFALTNSTDISETDAAEISIKETTEYIDSPPKYIVGIGASAGGLEALQQFIINMPPNTGLAFVIVQHLSPDYKSLMVELLSKHTQMQVLRVENGVKIQANCVYLIPPKKNMVVNNGKIYLSEQPQRHALNLPIDIFFKSLAEDQGERAIGIILSGTGSDGTRGIRSIKGEGGTVMVQDEISAQFDGMPKSAIATGLADFILSPANMPEQLLKFISHPYVSKKEEAQHRIETDDNEFTSIFRLLNKKANVDFSLYKPATVVRRIERRMGIVQLHSLDDYISYLHSNPKEISALFKDLLIGVTKFFRDTKSFEILKNTVIPDLVDRCIKKNEKIIRAWIAGCSTGEEAYSIAMLIKDHLSRFNNLGCEVKLFATDIDRDAIEFASMGIYPDSIVADVDVELLSKYFEKRANGYQVKQSIREIVIFATQNLIKDPPFTKVDFISCRNLLIYLQPVLQKKVLSIFNYALLPDGCLFLGSSETISDMSDSFEPIDQKNRIYKHLRKGELPVEHKLFGDQSAKDMGVLASYYRFKGNTKEMLPAKKFEVREKYYHEIIRKISPTVFIINEQRELIQAFGEKRKYLVIPEGNVTMDIISLLPREISLALSSAIHKVRKENQPITYDNIRIKEQDNIKKITLKVDFIRDPVNQAILFVIVIDHEDTDPLEKIERGNRQITDAILEQRVNDLEQEIQFTRENLQATIEELQTSNEELQATNEELLAANEELQSTNEELQSVNEELNTVNAEYQTKNIELTELNNDMKNLMKSTDIGTIFLDKSLHIRKYTPAVTRVIKILDRDIGRPFTDLSFPLIDNVVKDIQTVLESGDSIERSIDNEKQSYLLRILPFIDDQNEANGVVITLINITQQRNTEKAFKDQYKLLERILEASSVSTIMVNIKGKITFVNKNAEKLFGYTKKALEQMSIDSSKLNFLDLDGNATSLIDTLLAEIFKSKREIDNFIIRFTRKAPKGTNAKQEIVIRITGNPTLNENRVIDGAVLVCQEVAHQNE